MFSVSKPWAVVLAGGEGTRLQGLTRRIAGDSRPKQFCPIFGGKTLLRQTCDRVQPLFQQERTAIVVTRTHEAYYRDELDHEDYGRAIIQPYNRGTGVAMTVAILQILEADPSAVVAFFPSDHYYSNDDAFRSAIQSAMLLAQRHAESIILLGAEADTPEVEYGWIEPGAVVANPFQAQLFRVSRFWEKPSFSEAQALLRAGCLWNTFVTIGSARAFLDLLISQIPDVVLTISALLCGGDLNAGFERVRPVDFSRDVLAPQADRLLVLRDVASGWADLGNSSRVIDTLVRNRVETDWLQDMVIAQTA